MFAFIRKRFVGSYRSLMALSRFKRAVGRLDARGVLIGEEVRVRANAERAHGFPTLPHPRGVDVALGVAWRPGGGDVAFEPDLPVPPLTAIYSTSILNT
jgi:hypothetical protein